MQVRTRSVVVGSMLAIAGVAVAAPPSFDTIGFGDAKGVSEDGRTIVGEVYGGDGIWQYTEDFGLGFVVDLFETDVTGMSNDGRVIGGMAFTTDPNDPSDLDLFGYFFEDDDEEPFFEFVVDTPTTGSTVYDISGDGRVAVGQANRGFRDGDPTRDNPDVGPFIEEPMYYTRATGVMTLPTLGNYPNDVPSAKVLATDGTGSVAVGEDIAPDMDDLGPGEFLVVGVVWDIAGGGTVSRIPQVPGSVGTFQPATAVSDNGRFVGGVALVETTPAPIWEAYLYDRQTGQVSSLGPIPDLDELSGAGVVVPNAISNDGLRVIGTIDTTENLYDYPRGAAFLWSPGEGVRLLRDVLFDDFGIDTGSMDLRTAWDMSSDGQYVVGRARNSQTSDQVGYRIGLPESTAPCPADLTGPGGGGEPDGVIDASDFFFYLGLFAAGESGADIAGPGGGGPDGVIDATDFFAYLTLFSNGCP